MTEQDVPYHEGEATEKEPGPTGTSGGSGDHPSPAAPPRGSAPGTAPGGEAEIEKGRDTPTTEADEILDADRVARGSKSTPDD